MAAQDEVAQLKAHIQQMQEQLKKYEGLAEAVRNADVKDLSIYTESLDFEDILAIDRDDYGEIIRLLSELDLWRPWKSTIKRQISI